MQASGRESKYVRERWGMVRVGGVGIHLLSKYLRSTYFVPGAVFWALRCSSAASDGGPALMELTC